MRTSPIHCHSRFPARFSVVSVEIKDAHTYSGSELDQPTNPTPLSSIPPTKEIRFCAMSKATGRVSQDTDSYTLFSAQNKGNDIPLDTQNHRSCCADGCSSAIVSMWGNPVLHVDIYLFSFTQAPAQATCTSPINSLTSTSKGFFRFLASLLEVLLLVKKRTMRSI